MHELLHQCGVKAFTEVNETVGYGQTGPAEGLAFYPGTNSVILVSLDDERVVRVTRSVKTWCEGGGEASRLAEAFPAHLQLSLHPGCLESVPNLSSYIIAGHLGWICSHLASRPEQ